MGSRNDSPLRNSPTGTTTDRRRADRPRGETTRVRIVATAEGRQWVVRELPPLHVDGQEAGSLVFSSDHVMRRVRNYPLDWFDWPDADLLSVSWRR